MNKHYIATYENGVVNIETEDTISSEYPARRIGEHKVELVANDSREEGECQKELFQLLNEMLTKEYNYLFNKSVKLLDAIHMIDDMCKHLK